MYEIEGGKGHAINFGEVDLNGLVHAARQKVNI